MPPFFQDPETEAKYQPVHADHDPIIHQPMVYSGKLSQLPLAAADVVFSKNGNLLSLKPPPAPAKPEPAKPEAKKEEAKPGGSKN